MELAYEFHVRNLPFNNIEHNPALSTFLRKVRSLFVKTYGHNISPGKIKALENNNDASEECLFRTIVHVFVAKKTKHSLETGVI